MCVFWEAQIERLDGEEFSFHSFAFSSIVKHSSSNSHATGGLKMVCTHTNTNARHSIGTGRTNQSYSTQNIAFPHRRTIVLELANKNETSPPAMGGIDSTKLKEKNTQTKSTSFALLMGGKKGKRKSPSRATTSARVRFGHKFLSSAPHKMPFSGSKSIDAHRVRFPCGLGDRGRRSGCRDEDITGKGKQSPHTRGGYISLASFCATDERCERYST